MNVKYDKQDLWWVAGVVVVYLTLLHPFKWLFILMITTLLITTMSKVGRLQYQLNESNTEVKNK